MSYTFKIPSSLFIVIFLYDVTGAGTWKIHKFRFEIYHLLKVMHFVDMFVLIPESVGSVDEHKIFVFVVSHLGDIVKVHIL